MQQNTPIIIGGKEFVGKNSAEKREPYTGKLMANVTLADSKTANLAVERSLIGFQKTRQLNSFSKIKVLTSIAEKISSKRKELAELISREVAKPLKFSLAEVERAVQTFGLAAEQARKLGQEFIHLDLQGPEERRYAISGYFPAGVVLCITPFNFPLNLAAHKIAPAIALGAPFILKPAPQAPLTALELGKIVLEAGYPPEAVSVVPCDNEVAESLVKDPRIKVLSFTGSSRIGWMLKELSAKKKVILECGGNAGVIIDSEIGGQQAFNFAIARCIQGAFNYAGQVCISLQRIYVHQSRYEDFKAKFLDGCKKVKIGDPIDPEVDLSCLISEEAARITEKRVNEAVAQGAQLLIGGKRDGSTFYPTVLENTTNLMEVNREEIFAPVVSINKINSLEEGIDLINDSAYGLQAGVFTNNINKIMAAFDKLEVGGVIINDVPTYRHDSMPYGGTKASGFGREGLKYAIQEMAELKLLVVNQISEQ